MINISKLVRFNLSHPYEQRVSYLDLKDKTEFYRMRGHVAALYSQIRKETEPQPIDIDNKWL